MLFELLDKVEVLETGRIGIIHKIETVNVLEYFWNSGESLTRTEFRYYVLGVHQPLKANDIKTVEKQFIDKP
jgi:hypothetical protein